MAAVAVVRAPSGQQACQLAAEHAARAQVDVEVTGVVRHAQLLGQRSDAAVDEESRPRRISLLFTDRHASVAV